MTPRFPRSKEGYTDDDSSPLRAGRDDGHGAAPGSPAPIQRSCGCVAVRVALFPGSDAQPPSVPDESRRNGTLPAFSALSP